MILSFAGPRLIFGPLFHLFRQPARPAKTQWAARRTLFEREAQSSPYWFCLSAAAQVIPVAEILRRGNAGGVQLAVLAHRGLGGA